MAKRGVLDLSVSDLEIVQGILARYVPDRPVFVFRSRVTGRAGRRSDLDLAIGGTEPLPLGIRADLSEAFDDSDLPITVDFVDLTTARGIFRQRIESEWVPLRPNAGMLKSADSAEAVAA